MDAGIVFGMRLLVLAIALGCARPQNVAPIARDSVDAVPTVADAGSPSFPISEAAARTLVAMSPVVNPPTSVDHVTSLRRTQAPRPGCDANDTDCGWTFSFGNNWTVLGTCFVHAHTGAGTCTETGKKPHPIGRADAK
jgi:hypothetical protein